MNNEYTDDGNQATPRGWEALSRTHDTARLWHDYSGEINQENRQLMDALQELLTAVATAPGVRGPQGSEFTQHITVPMHYARLALGKAQKRQRSHDGGGQ